MRVLIYTGYQKLPFNKNTWKELGAGGTEYSVIKLADYLFSEGHDVVVSGEVVSDVCDGVIYTHIRELIEDQHFDVVIATAYIHYIKVLENLNISYNKSFFWIHNEDFYGWYNGELLENNGRDYLLDTRLTKVVAVSDYQKRLLEKTYPEIKNKIIVISNAIDPYDWEDINIEKYENKFIYTSAADRGLEHLLNIWPEIKNIIPEATLWVATPPYALDWYEDYKGLYDGVHFLDNLSPTELYTQIKSSEYWIYPSQYAETYCITALEMMFGKVKIVSTDTGNLGKLLLGKSSLISTPADTNILKEQILQEFKYLYNNKALQKLNQETAYNFAKNENWSNRINDWMNLIENDGRLYPELYTYQQDPQGWIDRFVTYSARTKEWDLITDEPFDNCFSFPLFTEEFCKMAREEAEHCKCWTTNRHENYPTTDMLLDTIGLQETYMEILKQYVMPLAIHMWALNGSGWDNMSSENFLAKYTPKAQGHLGIHHDSSDITCLIQLSDLDEYEGGGTWFRRQKKLIKNSIGYATLHPGNITHKHGARAVTSGARYIIVSFMKNLER